ncbi:GxxExxY protein [Desulfosoma caldarium]|uniref:Uncharacterized protein n=1 Tax=Desulfosoma caldarium TaxID=610254 RepID=A0A3N1VM43_9BACT|nr:hypothetical protein [Desulfosoma caldarium]ROR03119.1 hypothetical protein EDC27_0375 [Desulfosoma caldarium]
MSLRPESLARRWMGIGMWGRAFWNPRLKKAWAMREAQGAWLTDAGTLPLSDKGKNLECGDRPDFLVEDTVLVESNACKHMEPPGSFRTASSRAVPWGF